MRIPEGHLLGLTEHDRLRLSKYDPYDLRIDTTRSTRGRSGD